VQEADMQLVTRGGDVAVKRCKANHAAINTAREPHQAGQGGDMQVGAPWHKAVHRVVEARLPAGSSCTLAHQQWCFPKTASARIT
jgi:hypothetical protein